MTLTGNIDFTPAMYRELILHFKVSGYNFMTFEEYCSAPKERSIILRHDVDRHPGNALELAGTEMENGIKASYHFRIAKCSNDPAVIREIAAMGHEIAYHYEDLAVVWQASKKTNRTDPGEIANKAFELFCNNLQYFRQFYPVKVISMHGSPLAGVDNRLIWKYFNYRGMGIVCEPYFDIDHSEMLYLTDTGRRWNGEKFNIRDKISYNKGRANAGDYSKWAVCPVMGSLMNMKPEGIQLKLQYSFHSTPDIISACTINKLPAKIIINTHPQRWESRLIPWFSGLCGQSVKNSIKYLMIISSYRK